MFNSWNDYESDFGCGCNNQNSRPNYGCGCNKCCPNKKQDNCKIVKICSLDCNSNQRYSY